MEEAVNYTELITKVYADDIRRLSAYISYFEMKSGRDVAAAYDGSMGDAKMKFPVYDGTLIAFTNEASQTKLMDPNYIYQYRKSRIATQEQEKEAIENAEKKDVELLRAILSRYVLEGRYKGSRWVEGTERKVFLNVLKKLQGFLEDSRIR
ncbi:MAG: DUF6508 domain-containing protein [Lachnospiraceae bacterium]|nr:DUF6508 domain-containing protein [Lachnospiraceae bacterium]